MTTTERNCKVPMLVLTGFLGSGKTTLLKEMIKAYSSGMKVAVIQNEFGNVNIDARELESEKVPGKLVEVNNGSVFCLCLLSSFVKTCEKLVDSFNPDVIILEATGLADPVAISELFTKPPLSNHVYLLHNICVVDSSAFLKIEPNFLQARHQVQVADSIVCGKSDHPQSADKDVIEKRLRELNPYAEIMHADYGKIPLDDPFKLDRNTVHSAGGVGESCERPPLDTVVLKSNKTISQCVLKQFLELYRDKTLRIKGYVNLDDKGVMAVQTTTTQFEMKRSTTYTGPTELVAIGEGLDAKEFQTTFSSMTEIKSCSC